MMTARPPAFFSPQKVKDFRICVQADPRTTAHTTPARLGSAEKEIKGHERSFWSINDIRGFSELDLLGVLTVHLTFSACLHRYRCKM